MKINKNSILSTFIFDQIIEKNGDCLGKMCNQCPFRRHCLSEFLTGKMLSEQKRVAMAHSVLFRVHFLDEVLSLDDIESDLSHVTDEYHEN